MNKKGFVSLTIVIAILVGVLVVSAGGYLILKQSKDLSTNSIPHTNKAVQIPAGWGTYNNPFYGFAISYPKDWKIESDFPGRLSPGQEGPKEGVDPQNFYFLPEVKMDLGSPKNDITVYVAPSGYWNCASYKNVSATDVNGFLMINKDKNEIQFCRANNYFRLSSPINQSFIFAQMLDTFAFTK